MAASPLYFVGICTSTRPRVVRSQEARHTWIERPLAYRQNDLVVHNKAAHVGRWVVAKPVLLELPAVCNAGRENIHAGMSIA